MGLELRGLLRSIDLLPALLKNQTPLESVGNFFFGEFLKLAKVENKHGNRISVLFLQFREYLEYFRY